MFAKQEGAAPSSNSNGTEGDASTQQQQTNEVQQQQAESQPQTSAPESTSQEPSSSGRPAQEGSVETAKGSLLVVNEPDATRRARLQNVLAEYLPHALIAGSAGGADGGRKRAVGALRVTGHEAEKVGSLRMHLSKQVCLSSLQACISQLAHTFLLKQRTIFTFARHLTRLPCAIHS